MRKNPVVQAGLVLACLVFLSGWLLSQTATTEYILPLIYIGGTPLLPGELNWKEAIRLRNTGIFGVANFNFYKADGSGGQLVSVNGSTPTTTATWQMGSGLDQELRLGGLPNITTLWAKVVVPLSGISIVAQNELYTRTNSGVDAFSGFTPTDLVASGFKSKEISFFPVVLGKDAIFSQKQPVIGVVNPSASVATNVTLKLYDQDNLVKGAETFTVAPMAQAIRFLWFNGGFGDFTVDIPLGHVELTADQEISAAGVQFLNDKIAPILVQKGIFHPVVAPGLGVDAPTSGQTIASSSVAINGWRFKKVALAGGAIPALPTIQINLDGAVQSATISNFARPDVVATFPQFTVPANCGFNATLTGVTNGVHTIRIVATDDLGATTETTVSFTVSKPAIVPEIGDYFGPLDPALSSPVGVTANGRFWVHVSQSGGSYFVDRWDAFLTAICDTNREISFGILPSLTVPIVNGDFSFTDKCGKKTAIFLDSRTIQLRSETNATCMAGWGAGCQAVVLVSTVRK